MLLSQRQGGEGGGKEREARRVKMWSKTERLKSAKIK